MEMTVSLKQKAPEKQRNKLTISECRLPPKSCQMILAPQRIHSQHLKQIHPQLFKQTHTKKVKVAHTRLLSIGFWS